MKECRVRFAPSPTGYLHIGGARTALFNWLLAKRYNGKFILRIEDTDQERSTKDSEEVIFRAMKWLGLDWDEGPLNGGDFGPYRQSERLYIYREYAQKLVAQKKAFKCYCTNEELDEERKKCLEQGKDAVYSGRCRNLSSDEVQKFEKEGRKPVIRFEVPKDKQILFTDLSRGDVKFDSNLIGDFVLLKTDGFPSYNFAVVIDDYSMKITHVIRGDDHLTNTPKQILLYEALKAKIPEFAHIPMILGNDGSRLSKRHGATSVEEYQKDGFIKEAVVNYLSLLGWSPKSNEEIIPIESIIEKFELKDVSKSPAVFDNTKLRWMNSQYIQSIDIDKLVDYAIPFVDKKLYDISDKAFFKRIMTVISEPITVLADVNKEMVYYFDNTIDKTIDEEIKEIFSKESAFTVVENYIERLGNIPENDYNEESLKQALRTIQNEFKIKGKELFMPMRVALTYKTSGPGVYEMLIVLGKERSLKRMKEFLEAISVYK
ncbi:MAG: glutamate--tRNA ligase [Candidatus Muirbacterium halophilum]|nr:glutamate--tRNA ligase [Candidatus Muirbacterium halophilum]MCK9477684.1 glutamate--tRNA ligase [Candidatus Muirbacterium halophilum]